MKKEIEAFVNAANEQELEAAWNNLSAEEQRVFEQLMEEDSPEDALAFFAQLLQKGLLALIAAGHGIGGVTDFLRGSQFWNPEGGQVLDMEIAVLIYIGAVLLLLFGQGLPLEVDFIF